MAHRGNRRGLLYEAGCIARSLEARALWGEATDISAGFYDRKNFNLRKVLDRFYIGRKRLLKFQAEYDKSVEGGGICEQVAPWRTRNANKKP